MKSRFLLTLITIVMPMIVMGQSFDALWAKVKAAEDKDLPKTQQEVLMQIVKKAQREGAYGQLMAAELKAAQVSMAVAPDSLSPAVDRMAARMDACSDEAVKAVYAAVIGRICKDNPSLERTPPMVELTPALCEKLAAVKAADYQPLTTKGRDSQWFDNDMLSVVGFELKDYQPLNNYYEKTGNRLAALMTAFSETLSKRPDVRLKTADTAFLNTLDSLIDRYGDLPECGEVAIERYRYMQMCDDVEAEQKWQYLQQALNRWGSYERINELRNELQVLTHSWFSAVLDKRIVCPGEKQMLNVIHIRSISELAIKLYRVKTDGDTKLNPNLEADYKKLKPLLTEMPERRMNRQYSGKEEYAIFRDSVEIEGLPVGVYMIEVTGMPNNLVARQLYFVSNLRTMMESLPDRKTRYVVVDAIEGQPVKGATIELRTGKKNGGYNTMATLTTDDKGEAVYRRDGDRAPTVFTYTANDRACLPMTNYGNFFYIDVDSSEEFTMLFTDRAIYRPGQTVKVVATHYIVTHGYEQKAREDRALTLTLRDANFKVVAEQTAITDRFGSCAAEFTLPSDGLTGNFSIETDHGTCYFRVEEYKRPTFEVVFDEVTDSYEEGDTVVAKAIARTYAGVPVQNAKVKYKVMRRSAWWWRNNDNDKSLAEGETVTDSDGAFTVDMPMVLPNTLYPMFCNIECEADVTDQGGETHQGLLKLPLGNRKTAFSLVLPEKVRIDQGGVVRFTLRNAAGNDVEGTAKYRISRTLSASKETLEGNGGKWLTAKTNTPIDLPKLASGRYMVEAICEGDTVKKSFVCFSLDDKRPVPDTDIWFYQSDGRFPNDGSPVTVQVGSSEKNVHIVYNIFSGDRIIESGAVDRSNELINRKLTYKEEYGNGLLLTFGWVKHGEFYSCNVNITRPMPDKRLKLEWKTFRDRLTPGQQEEWSLTVKHPDGTPADAQLMATLYDKSLDQIVHHYWSFTPYMNVRQPSTQWHHDSWGSMWLSGEQRLNLLNVKTIQLTHFDETLFPLPWMGTRLEMRLRGASVLSGSPRLLAKVKAYEAESSVDRMTGLDVTTVDETLQGRIAGLQISEPSLAIGNLGSGEKRMTGNGLPLPDDDAKGEVMPEVQLRENLQETAFFYPMLNTDSEGAVTMTFTLPESLTTWHFMGVAHTPDLCNGMLKGEAVAKKDLMVQPNVPRFVREGDKATIAARIVNTSDRDLSGTAWLTLTDPETEQTVLTRKQAFTVKAGETSSATFNVDVNEADGLAGGALLVAKVMAEGDGFSDGEQHYLPILPCQERVTVTVPFTQNEPGTKTIDLTTLVPATVKDAKLTFEYTNNPVWLMIQALPTVGHPADDCAICQGASLYANAIGKFIMDQVPQAKTVFEQWKREQGSETSLHSQLQKNQELKDLVLSETPWVNDADREEEQRQRLADFFDENTMQQRLKAALDKLRKLQHGDGSWSWWPDMRGSIYMTISVAEMMARLNNMLGNQTETNEMLGKAMKFLGNEMVELVKEMKKQEKKGYKQTFPGNNALQWLYICALDGRQLPVSVQQANDYLVKLLKKETKNQTIYQKALSAIILNSPTYIKSLKEYTVYTEEAGRYYDTPRATYSWRDYRIPTQVAAIEAIQRLTPTDKQTLDEMRRWLLHEKRTQAWDTPLNSVDAVYAFLSDELRVKSEEYAAATPSSAPTGTPVGNSSLFTLHSSLLKLDGKEIDTPKATAGIGYVKTAQHYAGEKTFTAEKTSEGTSWGAVYAQFMQTTSDITDQASGVSVKRELFIDHSAAQKEADANNGQRSMVNVQCKVGDRIIVRLTIESERDLDFVQLQDKRAACLEPLSQLSAYNWSGGYYCTPRDNVTNYYFDRLSKGKHVIETEYYVDRAGQYETGTCTVQCAYAPEYRGTTHSVQLTIEP